MKKILLSIFTVIGFLSAVAQPCITDTTLTDPGIYPLNGTSTGFEVFMPPAMVNVPYNEIVQLLIPADTIIDTMGFQIPAQVLSMEILNFAGLPPSMAYTCSNANCSWAGNEHGCAVFHGTPSWAEVGTYDVDIVVYVDNTALNYYIQVTGCMSVCVYVPKDLINRLTDMVLLYLQ